MTDGKRYTGSASPEWYTPAPLRALARRILGGAIACDFATCAENPMQAAYYLTADNGPRQLKQWTAILQEAARDQLWPGVWLNPPYGREIKGWLHDLHLLHAGHACRTLALVPCRPGAAWYAELTGPWGVDLVCELRGRVTFDTRDAAGLIVPGSSPAAWASALLYQAGSSAPPKHLQHVRRQLSRVGLVRGAGRARRAAFRAPDGRSALPWTDPRQTEIPGTGARVLPFRRP